MSHDFLTIDADLSRNLALDMQSHDPAWKGLGTPSFDERQTSDRMIERAGLDWHVSKRPLKLENGAVVPGFYATVRDCPEDDERSRVLGIVGERYRVWQNHDAFQFADSLVADGILEYENAFCMKGGQQVSLLARMPAVDFVAENDPGLRYLYISTSHDGSGGIDILPTRIRQWCANQTRLIKREGASAAWRFTFRHTESLSANLAEARRAILEIDRAFSAQAELERRLVEAKVSQSDAREYVERLYPAPSEATDEATEENTAWGITLPTKVVTAKAVTIHRNKIATLRDAFRHPAQQNPSIAGSWYQLWSAVTFAVDHETRTRGRNGAQRAENRLLNVVDGVGAALKTKAFNLALEMSA
jgi:phage/plasmid-like protein (TIGR03299 family)